MAETVRLHRLTLELIGRRQTADSRVSAVDEKLAKQTIDLMVTIGLQKAGYQYFCLDGEAGTDQHPLQATCRQFAESDAFACSGQTLGQSR